jgi:hypothetical protein
VVTPALVVEGLWHHTDVIARRVAIEGFCVPPSAARPPETRPPPLGTNRDKRFFFDSRLLIEGFCMSLRSASSVVTPALEVEGLCFEFRVWGLGFGVWDLRFGV